MEEENRKFQIKLEKSEAENKILILNGESSNKTILNLEKSLKTNKNEHRDSEHQFEKNKSVGRKSQEFK